MARQPKRILTDSVVGFIYESEADVPWNVVEKAANPKPGTNSFEFSEVDKHDIFLATERYAEAFNDASGGIAARDLARARSDILKVLKATRTELAKFFVVRNGDKLSTELDALHMIYTTDGVNIPASLSQIRRIAASLEQALKTPPEEVGGKLDRLESSARKPELVALEAFIRYVLFASQQTPARSNPGYLKTPKLFEYRHWGIHIGPKSQTFREFINTLLKTEFSAEQVRNAFKAIRQDGFETLEQTVDRHVNGGE